MLWKWFYWGLTFCMDFETAVIHYGVTGVTLFGMKFCTDPQIAVRHGWSVADTSSCWEIHLSCICDSPQLRQIAIGLGHCSCKVADVVCAHLIGEPLKVVVVICTTSLCLPGLYNGHHNQKAGSGAGGSVRRHLGCVGGQEGDIVQS